MIVPTYNEADTVERIVTRGYEILLEVFSKGKYAPGRVREVLHVFPRRERGESKLTPAEYKDSLGHLLPLRMHDR